MAAVPIPDEVEVKLEAASRDALEQIAALSALPPYRLRRRRVQALETTYLDTADLALVRARVALRVRRNGRRWEATAKWPGRVAGALHTRPELTVPLPGPPAAPFEPPAGPLRDALQPYLLGRPLRPVLLTRVERRLLDLLPADGTGSLAEVALDTVSLCRPDGEPAAAEYWEVEIEQRAGTPADCVAAARALRQQFSLVASRATKFERGLAAVLPPTSTPVPAEAVAAGDSLATATRTIIAGQLGRMRCAQARVLGGDEPESVHDMRVAIRRLRTALRLGKAALLDNQRAALARELRWLGGELGALRDLDVQLANADWHRRRLDADARGPLDGFRRALRRQRQAARAALHTALGGPRQTRLLLAIERAATPPRRPPTGEAAEAITAAGRRAIKRAARKILERGNAVGELPSTQELHDLRIRAKRLRYVLEALQPITGGDGRRLTRQLIRLQDVLGRFNDSIVAAATIRRYRNALPPPTPEATREALTGLVDAELRRAGAAQAQFHRAWRRFARKGARRRLRALLERLT
jgi:inorganic triphosphatase YgiF